MAFTKTTILEISAFLDFYNIMTYDLMNKSNYITKHHTGLQMLINAISVYEEIGMLADNVNLGFAFCIKWYKTDPRGECDKHPDWL